MAQTVTPASVTPPPSPVSPLLPLEKPAIPGATLSVQDPTKAPEKTAYEVLRVLSPGVFDVTVEKFQVRFRAWGVGFPKRDQPGFREALRFTEQQLLPSKVQLIIKQQFDLKNLKLVDILSVGSQTTFSRQAILSGHGWHLEKETNRYGPFTLAQMKAKRMVLGVWRTPLAYTQADDASAMPMPKPKLPGALFRQQQGVPTAGISYWVSSLGKVHRPGCAFYRKGRGLISNAPQGYDCRICGGRNGKGTR
ncbi:MAG: hypothetical protein CMI26_03885 [Opitutae bacterium]|nr:hypothetical protein [Opitutae bacterium]